MMHGLLGQKVAAQPSFHHQDMVEDVTALPAPGMVRYLGHKVALLVLGTAVAPVAVRVALLASASGTGRGLHVLSCPARAQIVGSAGRAAQMPAGWLKASAAFSTNPGRHKYMVLEYQFSMLEPGHAICLSRWSGPIAAVAASLSHSGRNG